MSELLDATVFVKETTLIKLGRGAGLSIWGFRSCAGNAPNCGCVSNSFEAVFGSDGPHMLDCVEFFAQCVAKLGRRKVGLASPGHIHITHDEASVLATISAAQAGDYDVRNAHLAWLLADEPPLSLKRTIDEIADGFTALSIDVLSPEYDQQHPQHLQKTTPIAREMRL
ncbi:MAG: hypothetical protein AAF607_10665 [Pseudomonadota bacterium]